MIKIIKFHNINDLLIEPSQQSGFQTNFDTNQPVQSQRSTRDLNIIWIEVLRRETVLSEEQKQRR